SLIHCRDENGTHRHPLRPMSAMAADREHEPGVPCSYGFFAVTDVGASLLAIRGLPAGARCPLARVARLFGRRLFAAQRRHAILANYLRRRRLALCVLRTL